MSQRNEEAIVFALESWLQVGVAGGRGSSLAPNGSSSPPALRIPLRGDNSVQAALSLLPTELQFRACAQPCQAPGELWILPEWSSASSASRVKRGHFTFDTKRQPVSFTAPRTC
ncbi:unnamed protein product [Pipistrellus nathusii]|uniref:Uncharacterized protein n=1 Tax=Pipistrellus nathusii TaxID=59473 RepID=A0ABP0A3E6_PIPNA